LGAWDRPGDIGSAVRGFITKKHLNLGYCCYTRHVQTMAKPASQSPYSCNTQGCFGPGKSSAVAKPSVQQLTNLMYTNETIEYLALGSAVTHEPGPRLCQTQHVLDRGSSWTRESPGLVWASPAPSSASPWKGPAPCPHSLSAVCDKISKDNHTVPSDSFQQAWHADGGDALAALLT
jgi:hypothetical protein